MTPEELELAELVYDEIVILPYGYGWWKQTTEDLIGRRMETTEASVAFDMVSRNRSGIAEKYRLD